MQAFAPLLLSHGPLAELGAVDRGDRTDVAAWSGGRLRLAGPGTHFGFVFAGPAALRCAAGDFTLQTGMYFAVPDALELAGAGAGLVITARAHHGLFALGGPIEAQGRLRYIDGCTDTLLLAPPRLGDPCLNALYFPPHTRQSAHTHPSLRVGVVARGEGECVLPDARVPLRPGLAFAIAAGAVHSFATAGAELVVVAYHPDSDHGPADESHPMINRTFLDGVPAPRALGLTRSPP